MDREKRAKKCAKNELISQNTKIWKIEVPHKMLGTHIYTSKRWGNGKSGF